jgi:hypothetical protein
MVDLAGVNPAFKDPNAREVNGPVLKLVELNDLLVDYPDVMARLLVDLKYYNPTQVGALLNRVTGKAPQLPRLRFKAPKAPTAPAKPKAKGNKQKSGVRKPARSW